MILNKPICIGTSTLGLSKVLKQDFDFNYIRKKYSDKAEIFANRC